MKNILLLTITLLLVSSCGLFKKTEKTKGEYTLNTKGKVMVLSNVDSSRRHLEVEQSYHRFLKQSEDLMQIEGERIEISPDGIVRIGKGRINKKLTLQTNGDNGFKKYISEQREQVAQRVLHKNEKLQLAERMAIRTERPAVTQMLYSFIGLLVLASTMFWWLRRKNLR